MSIDPYDAILSRAKSDLSPEQQRLLVAELSLHTGTNNGEQRHSILELDGLGKELWHGIDPDEHVAKERNSWNG